MQVLNRICFKKRKNMSGCDLCYTAILQESQLLNKRFVQFPYTFVNCRITHNVNRPVVCASALKLFIGNLYYRHIQLPSSVLISQTKVSLWQEYVTLAEYVFGVFFFLLPNIFKFWRSILLIMSGHHS